MAKWPHRPTPHFKGKFFALEGELIQDQGHIVELDVGVFNLPGVTAVIPTGTAIANALAAAPKSQHHSGSIHRWRPRNQRSEDDEDLPYPSFSGRAVAT